MTSAGVAETGAARTGPLVDARPVVPRSTSDIWSLAHQEVERIYSTLDRLCDGRGIQAKLLKTRPYSGSAGVELEVWTPVEGRNATDRSSLSISVEPAEHRVHSLEYRAQLVLGGQSRTFVRVARLDDASLERMALAVLEPREVSFRSLRPPCYRVAPWQLWRAQNPIRERDAWSPIPLLLLGALVVAMAASTLTQQPWILLAFLLFLAVGGLFRSLRRPDKRALFAGSAQPARDPWQLRSWDRWQAMMMELGSARDAVALDVFSELVRGRAHGITCERDRIWYWTHEGKSEREQYVVRFRRAMVFVSVDAYGVDLYVEWNSHLNSGEWRETVGPQVQRGGRRLLLTSVAPGAARLTDFDAADANYLGEWVHSILVRILKRHLADRRIDQAIDFQIIRGNRELGGSEGPAKAAESRAPRRVG